MTNIVIDPTTLIGAKTSPWRLLKNATVEFTRILTEVVDPLTGNPVPGDTETLIVPCYFGQAAIIANEFHGVPIGSYKIKENSYTVGILPDWCRLPSASNLPCVVDFLGSGQFRFQGEIHVVKDRVEQAGKGSQIQGYFTLQGSR